MKQRWLVPLVLAWGSAAACSGSVRDFGSNPPAGGAGGDESDSPTPGAGASNAGSGEGGSSAVISTGAGGEAGQVAVLPSEFAISSDTRRVEVTLGKSADVSIRVERDASNDADIELTVTGRRTG